MIGVQGPVGQEFLDVAIREREAQIPTDGQENHLRFKLAPLEQTANRRGQEEHPASLSRGTCKVATLPKNIHLSEICTRTILTRVAASAHGRQEAYGDYENTIYNHPIENRNRLTK